MSFLTSTSNQGPGRVRVAMAGNVCFPQWRRFSRLPEGFAAPSDALFVAAMFAGLIVYLSLATALLACGMACHAVGRFCHALRLRTLAAVSLCRAAV